MKVYTTGGELGNGVLRAFAGLNALQASLMSDRVPPVHRVTAPEAPPPPSPMDWFSTWLALDSAGTVSEAEARDIYTRICRCIREGQRPAHPIAVRMFGAVQKLQSEWQGRADQKDGQ